MEDFLQRFGKLSQQQRGLLESRLQQRHSECRGEDGSMSDAPSRSLVDTPGSPLESALAGLWASILQVSNVSVNDDFVALGGDGHLWARLTATVNALFRVELAVDTPLP